ncbi:hypothetical protein CTZ27_38670 [Streptomyces griseocarneus]|nr:hypothetical protein CTZ27_38670 [Streptomyces griseocarneus]
MFGGCLVGSVVWGHDFVVMRLWAVLGLVTSLGPLIVWWWGEGRGRRGGDGHGGAVGSVVAPGAENAGVERALGERSPA